MNDHKVFLWVEIFKLSKIKMQFAHLKARVHSFLQYCWKVDEIFQKNTILQDDLTTLLRCAGIFILCLIANFQQLK